LERGRGHWRRKANSQQRAASQERQLVCRTAHTRLP
jgi:hypothetical protein